MAESWDMRELLSAGWSENDLAWEGLAESVLEATASADPARAKEEAGLALQTARAAFEPDDPRLGTSLANYALCLHPADRSEAPARLFGEALAVWRGAGPWIDRMDAPRVARSSLFHLRMEARHRDTYRSRWEQRWRELAAEAQARLEALITSGRRGDAKAAAEALSRWRRGRPAMLNDTRKLTAAVFLLLAPRV